MIVSPPAFGRSLGLKLIMVCALVLLMGIPALFISSISYERSNRANEVTAEVSSRYGGAQTVMGPIISVPYLERGADGTFTSGGEYIIFAETGAARIDNFETIIKRRSLFKVPTYQTEITFNAIFDMQSVDDKRSSSTQLVWDDAKLLVALSDLRGLRDDVFVKPKGKTAIKFSPAGKNLPIRPIELATENYFTNEKSVIDRSGLFFMEAEIGHLLRDAGDIEFETVLSVNGSQAVSTLPFAQSTKVDMIADWPHPGFSGQFAPISREITANGFSASWSVPFLARGIPASGPSKTINFNDLATKTLTTKLVSPVNPYQQVNRALKYSIMFIGLVFLTYFLFEIAIGVRVHAAQYILIGLAQSIFYLLLLAFSEHIGFTAAFALAALATVGATSAYAGAVFGGRQYIKRAAGVFATVYALLYTLMRMEDFALMVGALTSFLAISGTMYLTRNVNWYGKPSSDDPAVQGQAKPV